MFDFSPGEFDQTVALVLGALAYIGLLSIAGLGLSGWLARFSGITRRSAVFALGFALGPVLYAWFVTMMLRYTPGLMPIYYILGGLTPLLCGVLFLLRSDRLNLITSESIEPATRIWWIALIPTVMIALGASSLAFVLPLHGNDPLEYASVARLVANARNIAAYPFANPEDGFYGPWTHPPGYTVTLVIGYFVQGHTESAGVIRMAASYFLFATMGLVFVIAEMMRQRTGYIATFLLVATPILLHLVVQNHIDPMRIAAFTACALILIELCKKPGLGLALLLGAAAGLSHFCHSIGLITLPLLLPAFLALAPRSLKQRIGLASISIFAFLPVTMLFMLDSFRLYGSILSDTPPVWVFTEIPIQNHTAVTRDLDGLGEKIVFGVLKGFTFGRDFGLIYWTALLALITLLPFAALTKSLLSPTLSLVRSVATQLLGSAIAWLRQILLGVPAIPTTMRILLFVLATFYGFVLLTVLLGSDLAVKNSRYLLSVQPFVSAVGAIWLASALDRIARDGVVEPFRALWRSVRAIAMSLRA